MTAMTMAVLYSELDIARRYRKSVRTICNWFDSGALVGTRWR